LFRSSVHLLTLLALGVASDPANAQEGFPVDIERVRPGLSPRGGFAVDAPHAIVGRTWSAGVLVQYENAPLRLFEDGVLIGPLVAHRQVFQLHGGVSFSKRTSVSFMLPVSVHFGASDTEYGRDGAGLGDGAVSLRVRAGTWGRFSLGVLGTVLLPTGNRNQYMGERLPRLRFGLLGFTELGRVSLQTNLLAHVRETVVTGFDFVAGPELEADIGLQGHAIPEQLDVIAELLTRIGLHPGRDGGRVAMELLAGVRYQPRPGLRIDLALGRGITSGYGTSGIRAMVGLSYVGAPRPKPPPEPETDPMALPELDLAIEEPDPPPPPPPPPVVEPPQAQLAGEEIVFRDPIEFEVGTTTFKTGSMDVLDSIAEVIVGNPVIGHVVVEGHASQEGGFAYNYELSRERARVIYEALILRGVHPKRMSYRGAGEVERKVEGEDEAARERNRRVVFSVVRQYAPGEPRKVYDEDIVLPWSGEAHTVVEPVPEAAPEEAPEDEVETQGAAPPEPTPESPVDELDGAFDVPEDEAPVFEDEAEAPEPAPEPVVEEVPVPGDTDATGGEQAP